jgi:Tfp pilus assembly protein PilF
MLRRSLSLVTVFVLLTSSAILAQPRPSAADEAFSAGDHARALRLYDEVLAGEPANVHALIRSALILSWDKKYDEAVARYDRALRVNPNEPTALLERAKVLSWARRYAEAGEAFARLLRNDPQNRDARLGRARTLSWSGQQAAAREEYLRLVERDAKDAEALVGVAQTYAWSGDAAKARQWHERALAADPASVGARIGRAYLDLQESDRAAAQTAVEELSRQHPRDPDVAELRAAVQRAAAPQAEIAREVLSDSDNNELGITRLRATFPMRNAQVSLLLRRHEMEGLSRSGAVNGAQLQLSARPSRGAALRLRGGVDRVTRSDETTRDVVTGGLSLALGHEGTVLAVLSADRDVYKYSVPILDRGIVVQAYSARIATPLARLKLDAGAGFAQFSDDNDRVTADAALLYQTGQRLRFTTGYAFRYFDFDRSSGGGYFDPQDYTAHALQLGLSGQFGGSRAYYSLAGEVGVQSFELRGVRSDDDQFTGGTVTVGIPLGSVLLLELSANKSSSAVNVASGFESEQVALTLRIQR